MRLSEFRASIRALSARTINEYIVRAKANGPPSQPKEFNDPVWGTITLSPLEVLFLDSPLVQRLRYIRQLGVVHWVYPGAGHTRFEHTLGVTHQTQQILTAFNSSPDPALPRPIVDNNYSQLLRLAAIHHDIGHGPFSHVSENALERQAFVQDVINEFAEEQEIERAKLSEVIAHTIITSQEFIVQSKEFFALVSTPPYIKIDGLDPAEAFCQQMAATIIGKGIHQDIPLLHEIINGPFDADKLDYMTRDAMFTGVPNTVDISRLTQKITVQQCTPEHLPERIGRRVTHSDKVVYVLGLKWSGASVLDELYLGRTLLFSKVYRHPKVRAAEGMVEAAFALLAEMYSEVDLLTIYTKLTDDQILGLTQNTILPLLKEAGVTEIRERKKERGILLEIVRLLKERNLFIKSFAIQSRFLTDPLRGDSDQSQALKIFLADLSNTDGIAEFKERIAANTRTLLQNLNPELEKRYEGRRLRDFIYISKPNSPQGGSEISRAIVFPSGGAPITYSDASLNADAWTRAYSLSQASIGFIFTPKDLAPIVYVAAEKVVREHYGIILPPTVIDESKQKRDRIRQLKIEAHAFGFYDGSPSDLRPEPVILQRLDILNRIEVVAEKFSIVQEPVSDLENEPRSAALAVRVKNWLGQFSDSKMIECALVCLEEAKVLSRKDVVHALKAFLRDHSEFKGCVVCPIGAGKDSSSHIGYYGHDLSQDAVVDVMSIETLLHHKPRGPIVFFDDFTGSGGQVIDILGNWFSITDLKQPLGEQRLPLETADQRFLKESKVAFVFCAAWDKGLTTLQEALSKVGLNAITYADIREASIPFVFENCLARESNSTKETFRSLCSAIGRELLSESEEDEEKVADRVLGYGNRSMLIVFPYNVPTQTLTALWAEGTFKGAPWRPLFKRRKKR